jgi:molybdopterin synthase catalytic subunit
MIRVSEADFSVDDAHRLIQTPEAGCIVDFVGVVRGNSGGRCVDYIIVEVYQEMAERVLAEIRAEAISKFHVCEVLIHHRVGKLHVGDRILLISVAAGHRPEAYEASRYIIEEVKKRVPLWKKEVGPDGESWVEGHKPED